MLSRTIYLIRIYLTYVLAFVLMKPLFMLYNHEGYSVSFADVWSVVWHGFPLDLSTSGYLMAFPLLLMLLSCVVRIPGQKYVLATYYGLTALLVAIILMTDCALYPFWQFKLDATVFTYMHSIHTITANVSLWFMVIGIASILLYAVLLFLLLLRHSLPSSLKPFQFGSLLPLLLLGGVFFLLIRGGTGKSTMNIGSAYYSDNQFLNHSAVNPAFNLIASALKKEDLQTCYRYFDKEECERRYKLLGYESIGSDTDTLLTTPRPNVVVVILEGFAASFIEPLGGSTDVTPQFNRLSKEGLLFTQVYANSFRTDRGVLSTLSGYPAFPKISVMKLPEKSRSLPSLARSLSKEGYSTQFLYGGDVNFTNMKSYLLSTGYQSVMGDTYFPQSVRSTHGWGVTDHIAFDTLANQLLDYLGPKPIFSTFLTLASHEPWQVPYNRIPDNMKANAMAYTDDCIGRFVDKLRRSSLWNNLLLVFIADHGIGYPVELTESNPQRSHIPMLWLGGALRRYGVVDKYCQQSDLAATLLAQMHIAHSDFRFSRNVVSNGYTNPSVMHTFDNGFAYMDSTGSTVYDLTSRKVLTDIPAPSQERIDRAYTLLQTTIDDLADK